VLARTAGRSADLDAVELNEAFAVQVLACQRRLGLDMETLNADGGAIALGPRAGQQRLPHGRHPARAGSSASRAAAASRRCASASARGQSLLVERV
jgi:hypothetical protein